MSMLHIRHQSSSRSKQTLMVVHVHMISSSDIVCDTCDNLRWWRLLKKVFHENWYFVALSLVDGITYVAKFFFLWKKNFLCFRLQVIYWLCYLVDPASSDMLASRVKPCMSKYKHFILWNCVRLIISAIINLMVLTTWISVVILELIHA